MKTKYERRQWILNELATDLVAMAIDFEEKQPKDWTKHQLSEVIEDCRLLATAFKEGRVSIRKGKDEPAA